MSKRAVMQVTAASSEKVKKNCYFTCLMEQISTESLRESTKEFRPIKSRLQVFEDCVAHKNMKFTLFPRHHLHLQQQQQQQAGCRLAARWWCHPNLLLLLWSQESLATAPEDSLKLESAHSTRPSRCLKTSVAGCLKESDTWRSAARTTAAVFLESRCVLGQGFFFLLTWEASPHS